MSVEKQVEKGVSDIVGALTDPIIVFPGGWGEDLPEWLKNAITLERLVMNMSALKGEEMTGTDAEACAYLYTAALSQPMSHDWEQIYFYIAGKTYSKWSKNKMPEDIRVDSLTKDQEVDLYHLKGWLYRQRIMVRQESERTERRQARDKAQAQRKAEQPALFEFH